MGVLCKDFIVLDALCLLLDVIVGVVLVDLVFVLLTCVFARYLGVVIL